MFLIEITYNQNENYICFIFNPWQYYERLYMWILCDNIMKGCICEFCVSVLGMFWTEFTHITSYQPRFMWFLFSTFSKCYFILFPAKTLSCNTPNVQRNNWINWNHQTIVWYKICLIQSHTHHVFVSFINNSIIITLTNWKVIWF